MTDSLEAARAALQARQGEGARYDAATAPARDLDWARRGTAYFARMLNGLSDAALDTGMQGMPEARRRRVISAYCQTCRFALVLVRNEHFF